MKRRMTILTAILLCGAMLASCGGKKDAEDKVSEAASVVSSAEEAESKAEEAVTESTAAESSAAEDSGTAEAEEAETDNTEEAETADIEEEEEDLVPDPEAEEADAAEEEADAAEEGADAAEEETSDAVSAMMDEALKDPILEIPTIEGEYTTADCVKLGEYKGLKLDMVIDEVTDEDIDQYFSYLIQPVEVSDDTAVLGEGDTANLDFTGYLNDEAFDGGTGTDYDLQIGSGTFIPGFEEQMVGMKKDEERDLNLTFPENYASEDLAGQDVVFHVKLNAIKRMPEIDDAWASTYSNGQYATLDELREATRADLESQNRSYAETNLQNEAWNLVVDNSEVIAFPEVLLQEKRDEYMSYLESEAQIYNMTAAEYIEQMGMKQEDFDRINEVQVRTEVENELLLNAVFEAEAITEEDTAYQEELNRLTETYGMTVDELKETYGEDVLDRHLKSIVAISKILSYAEITETVGSGE